MEPEKEKLYRCEACQTLLKGSSVNVEKQDGRTRFCCSDLSCDGTCIPVQE